MKKTLIIAAAFMASVLSVNTAFSQITDRGPKPGIRLGIGGELYAPVGKFYKKYDGGYGGYIQADIPVISNNLYLTVNTGIRGIYAKENSEGKPLTPDMTTIPVKVGLKYFPYNRFYVQGEVGTSILLNKSDFNDGKRFSLLFAPQVGYLVKLGEKHNLDLGIRYERAGKAFAGATPTSFIGIRAGYAFNL